MNRAVAVAARMTPTEEQPKKQRSPRPAAKRIIPVFQSSQIVLGALHHLARNGSYERHRNLLLSCMAHIAASSHDVVQQIYGQALSIAWGSGNSEGLESVLLTGMQNAFLLRDIRGVELGRTALQLFTTRERPAARPIFFYDRSTSMITVLSPAEYRQARLEILKTPNATVSAIGIGNALRGFSLSKPRTKRPGGIRPTVMMEGPQVARSLTFDQSTCRAWVTAIIAGGYVVATVLGPELKAGTIAIDIVKRLASGVIIERTGGWGKILKGGGASTFVAALASPVICSSLNWVITSRASSNSDQSGSGTTGGVRPSDLGLAPSDFAAPSEAPEPVIDGPDAGVPTESGGTVEGTVDEGEGFTAVEVDGPTTVTLVGTDGGGQTVSVDSNGNTTVTSFDSSGNTTDVTSYDSNGNVQSGGGDGTSQSTEEEHAQSDQGEGGGRPPDAEGYPVPDSDGSGGPTGPAALRADLIAQPVPDGDGGGPGGPASLLGRGTTFLISGLHSY